MTNCIFYKTEDNLPERIGGYSSSKVVLGWYEHSQSWIFCFYDYSGDVWITHDDRGEILSKDQIKFWTHEPPSPYTQEFTAYEVKDMTMEEWVSDKPKLSGRLCDLRVKFPNTDEGESHIVGQHDLSLWWLHEAPDKEIEIDVYFEYQNHQMNKL